MKKSAVILYVLLLSTTARAQWIEPVRIGIPGAYLYPQILAAGDTLHVVGSNLVGGDKVVYLRSDDAGDTWSESHILSDTINSTNAMFVRIAKYGQQIIVFWRSIMNSGPRPWNIGYALSANNGDTWTGPLYISNPGWDHILYFSASGSGPVVNVILSSRINHELIFFNIRSTNFGQSWSGPAEIFNAAQSSLTDQVHFNDTVHFTWAGRFIWEGVWETYYMRSMDNGLTWSDNIMLSEDDQKISQLPAICTDQAGNVACTWWDFKYSPYQTTGDVLIRQSFDGGITWEPEDQVTAEHRARGSDVVWLNGTLHVAWRDYRFGNVTVYYVSSPDSIHDWSNKVRLEEDSAESNYPALAVSNEKVYVVWADDRCDPDTNICGGIYFTRLDNQVGIQEDGMTILPDESSLGVYPNPFNSTTIITYKNLRGGEIEIYNITGQKIRTFKTAEIKEGQIEWDARDALGNKVSSGIYFARVGGRSNYSTIKLLYLK